MRHFVIVGILVIVAATLIYLGLDSVGLMPVQASTQAISIDWIWNWEVVVMSFLFSLIMVPMIYSLIVFRRQKGDTTDGEHMEGNTSLEITWTVLPLCAVIVFAYMGAKSLGDISRVDPAAMVIKVHARQFTWTFEYPDEGIFSTELHLPVDTQVVLLMDSQDVIHSFWVPEFRVKQDVVPGRVTEYRITPNRVGNYQVRCAELCGTSHAFMLKPVVVSARTDIDTWLAEQKIVSDELAKTPSGQGQLLTVRNGCTGCHSLTSTPLQQAPAWFALFASKVELADGSTVIADDAYLAESIRNPKAQEVKGYSPSTMPQYALTDEQIKNIIAYIKTLK